MTGDFFLCYFETTRKCGLSCPYCMSRLVSPPRESELTTDEAKRLVLDEAKKHSPKAAMAFSGGEFLLRADALDLLAHSAGLGMWSFVNTSGAGLTKPAMGDVKSAARGKVVFVFSLDSLSRRDGAVDRDGSLASAEENVRRSKELGIPCFFVVTITRDNLGEIGRVIEYATRDGRPVLRSPFVPRGAGAAYRRLMFDRREMEETIHPVLRNTPLSYVSHTPFFAAPKFLRKNWLRSKFAIRQLGCQAGRGYIAVSPEGDVAPCVHLLDSEVTCGNVRRMPLSETLRRNEILRTLRDRSALKGKCGRCKYRETCGGCRAMAYYHSGDYLAEDPTCFFEPVDGKTASEWEAVQNENLGAFARFISSHSPWKEIFIP